MERVIKFRIWDVSDKSWVNGPCEYLQLGDIFSLNSDSNHHWPKDWIACQFTGILDKNNKEIYEGDIVSFLIPGHPHGPEREEYTNKTVWWDDENSCWGFGNDKYFYSIAGDRIDKNSFEITGNVFELVNDEDVI